MPEAAPDAGLTHWEGEPLRVWSELWGLPGLEAYRRISSTSDRVRALAAGGAPSLTAVLAEEQTAGRGRSGRRWTAPPGSSVLVSFLLRAVPATDRERVPLVAGLAVARAVEAVVPEAGARIKWPNDVLVEGRKVAGILCESGHPGAPGAVVVGVGINVRQGPEDFPPELGPGATSLELAAGRSVPRQRIAAALFREVRELLLPRVPALDGDLGEELARRDALRGRWVRVADTLEGEALGIGAEGALRVSVGGEVRRVVAGTVRSLEDD